MNKFCILLTLAVVSFYSSVAQKRIMDHPDFDIWHTIQNQRISSDGNYVSYHLQKGEKDNFFRLTDISGKQLLDHDRGSNGQFTYDSKFALFTIGSWQDSLREMKRRKIPEDELPKDTLAIYNIATSQLTKIPGVKSFKIPKKWSGLVAYQLHPVILPKDTTVTNDSLAVSTQVKKGKPGKSNGDGETYDLVIRNLNTGSQDTIKFVTHYTFSKKGKRLMAATSNQDSTSMSQVMTFDLENNRLDTIYSQYKAKIYQLSTSENGNRAGFIVDADTTKALIRPNELYLWNAGDAKATMVVDQNKLADGMMVSNNGSITFSEDESKMFFGQSELPILQDTSLLDEEIVNVEVWTYDEPRLYTVQKVQAQADREKSYLTAYHISENRFVSLASTNYPDITFTKKGNEEYALLSDSKPHQLASQWDGLWASNYATVNTSNGEVKPILNYISGTVGISPTGAYVYGYNRLDSVWFVYDVEKDQKVQMTHQTSFYNELNDSPNAAYPYGVAGWTTDDQSFVIYDRYDLWEYDPSTGVGKLLTNGRSSKTRYRYLDLDPDEENIPLKGKWLLSSFDESTKDAGYYELNRSNGKGKSLIQGAHVFSYPSKAALNDNIIYTRQSFREFPDIWTSDLKFKSQKKLSNANPMQSEYRWGNTELVKWTSADGIELEGILVKPDDFDPSKKYPLLVNFYEKSSDRLNRHWTPAPGRSTINYSFYVSRGYVIFNPNVHYRIGYPGESAFNCVISGVTSLIDKGFIDKDRIGVQGHSWGGYQIAYLVTKTDMFKAAEAGAPVPNMLSAYGGIRWETGLSRQFQYEHTQSRLGGTPWDVPSRYIENSPIYFLDKVNTPLLIMHNDADGHVPWYQGIELFVSLRRLGKPSWFLNYNNEPHWPLKRQNRVDFNIRLAQYFDYFLMDKPKPVWMKRGVPAIEKGINQGYEYIDE